MNKPFNLGGSAEVGNLKITGTPQDDKDAATVEWVKEQYTPPIVLPTGDGKRGQVPIIKQDGLSPFVYEDMLRVLRVTDDVVDFEREKQNFLSYQEMYDEWIRMSHDESGQQPAIPSDLGVWVYDATDNTINADTATQSASFFTSMNGFTDYEMVVSMNSTATTGNPIGFVLAVARDEIGRQYTLTAIRSYKANMKWAIYYNYNQPDEELIVENDNSVTLVESGWKGLAAKLHVIRTDNTFTIRTSQFGNPNIDPNTEIEIDLMSTEKLQKFMGGSNYGFMVHNQANTECEVLDTDIIEDVIVNLQDAKVYVGDYTGNYDAGHSDVYNEWIGPHRMLYNPRSRKLFYTKEYGFVYMAIHKVDDAFPVNPLTPTTVLEPNIYYRYDSTDDIEVTIPLLNIGLNDEYHFRQVSTGKITFKAASGVTLNESFDGGLTTKGKGASANLKRVDYNVYDVSGQLE